MTTDKFTACVNVRQRHKDWADYNGMAFSKMVRLALDDFIERRDNTKGKIEEIVSLVYGKFAGVFPKDCNEKYQGFRKYLNENQNEVATILIKEYLEYEDDLDDN